MTYRRGGGPPRRSSKVNANRLELLFFVEGLVTEDQYLKDLARRHRERVLVTVDDFRGGPLQLVQEAAKRKKTEAKVAKRGGGRGHDQVWVVFDADEHPNIPEALDMANANGINVAISNPCLELWFVLHFQDQTAEIHRHDAQRLSAALLGCEKALSESALEELDARFAEADARAQFLDRKHDGDGSPPRSNPSSTVGGIVRTIREAALP